MYNWFEKDAVLSFLPLNGMVHQCTNCIHRDWSSWVTNYLDQATVISIYIYTLI